MDGRQRKKTKKIFLQLLIISRLLTNEGIFLENRRPVIKNLPPEISRFISRPARRGRKRWFKDLYRD
jgi:hypothetical protein